MKHIQLFSDSDMHNLQYQVNEWLFNNKNIEIIHTNMNSFGNVMPMGDLQNEIYAFYILYISHSLPQGENIALEEAIPAVSSAGLSGMHNEVPTSAN